MRFVKYVVFVNDIGGDINCIDGVVEFCVGGCYEYFFEFVVIVKEVFWCVGVDRF